MSADMKKGILVIGALSGNERVVLTHHIAAMGNIDGAVLSVDECQAVNPEIPHITHITSLPSYPLGGLWPHAECCGWKVQFSKQPRKERKSHNPNSRQHRRRK